MRRISFIFVLPLLCLGLSSGLMAQSTNTESPYSRYGLGLPVPSGGAKAYGMGGVSLTLSEPTQVNTSNPASYTSQDSMSFLFDVSLGGRYDYLKTSTQTKHYGAGLIDHVAVQFPVGRYLGMSFSFQPYTNVGYKASRYETDPLILSKVGRVRYEHAGSGGTSLAQVGIACNPVRGLSFGVNVAYLFGSINSRQDMHVPHNTLYAQTQFEDRLVVQGLRLHAGVLGDLLLGGAETARHLIVGLTFEAFPVARGERRSEITQLYLGRENVVGQNELREQGALSLPMGIGMGLMYKDPRWEFAADAHYQMWKRFQTLSPSEPLNDKFSLHLGVQYVPNIQSQRYYMSHVNYRLGAYFQQLPMEIQGTRISDMGLSLGLGFPFRRLGSMFHVGLQVGSLGTTAHGLIRQVYLGGLLGISLNDVWFYKRKYN